jgi:hypothetical protein
MTHKPPTASTALLMLSQLIHSVAIFIFSQIVLEFVSRNTNFPNEISHIETYELRRSFA